MDLFDKCYDPHYGYFSEFRKDQKKLTAQEILEGPMGPKMKYKGREVITWSFNNYLGLADHPLNRAIEKETIAEYSTAYPMGSRFIAGNCHYHDELESKCSALYGKPQSLLFVTCYLGAIGVIPALVGKNDVVILDRDAHACLYDAAKMAVASGAQMRVFKHNDMTSLEKQLILANHNRQGGILIVTDGVYSMSGDLVDLPNIIKLKKKYNARLLIDDAHGVGVMGEQGRGTAIYWNSASEVDLILSAFSKAYGSMGGCISGEAEIIEFLKYNARTNIFSHSLPLIQVKKTLNSLKIIETQPELLFKLWSNVKLMQKELIALELDIGNTKSPITPIYIKTSNEKEGLEKLKQIIYLGRQELGVFMSGVTYPAIPSGTFIIRLVITALHSAEDIAHTIEVFKLMKSNGLL